jgi:hypothetical protein
MNTFGGFKFATISRITRAGPGLEPPLLQGFRSVVCLISNLTFRSCENGKRPAASGVRTKRLGVILMVSAAIGESLIDAIMVSATAAPARASLDPGDFLYGIAWYFQQVVQWTQDGIDTTLRAYSLDSHQVYSMVLILSVLAVFVCLMVKAFTLGKVAAERVSRDQ